MVNLVKKIVSEVKIEWGKGRNPQEALDNLRMKLPSQDFGVYIKYSHDWIKRESGDCIIEMTYIL